MLRLVKNLVHHLSAVRGVAFPVIKRPGYTRGDIFVDRAELPQNLQPELVAFAVLAVEFRLIVAEGKNKRVDVIRVLDRERAAVHQLADTGKSVGFARLCAGRGLDRKPLVDKNRITLPLLGGLNQHAGLRGAC